MSSHHPTDQQLWEAKQRLLEQRRMAHEAEVKIREAHEELERMIQESKKSIAALESGKLEIEKEIQTTKEFLSPMRRLPDDIIRHLFLECFENSAYASWRLAAVCSSWRRIALDMPRLWSKIRLVTATHESPDIIRVWLERSKSNIPLDIEVFLEVPPSHRHRRPPPSPGPWSPPLDGWYNEPPPPMAPLVSPGIPTAQTQDKSAVKLGMHNEIPQLQSHQQSIIATIARYSEAGSASSHASKPPHSPSSGSWGHVVFFYLTQQMHRWKRFIFRFERRFESIQALRSLSGRDAPLLEEFEISCGEILHLRSDPEFNQFDLLPNGTSEQKTCFPKLKAVTLRHMPFKWNTSLISGNLRSLQIQTSVAPIGPQSSQVTLDRVLNALAQNSLIEHLSLSFHAIHPSLLPLDSLKLPELRSLHLTGNLVMSKLLEAIAAPALEVIALNMDCEGLGVTLNQFFIRSQHPPVHTVSIGYDNTSMFGVGMHYPQPLDNEPGPWQFFSSLPQLRTLKIGRTNIDLLLDALKSRNGVWPVPQLEYLALRSCCSTMNEAELPKFLSVINERNPPLNGEPDLPAPVLTLPPPFNPWFMPPGHIPPPGLMGNITPPTPPSPVLPPAAPLAAIPFGDANHFERLRILEMHDCLTLGDNVLNFLRARILEVRYTRPFRYGCGPTMMHMID